MASFSPSHSLLAGFVMLMQTDVADSRWFFIYRWREIKGEWRVVAIVLTVRLSVTNKLLHCTDAIFRSAHLHVQASISSSLLKVYASSLGARRCEIKMLGIHSFFLLFFFFIKKVCVWVCVRTWHRVSVHAIKKILPYTISATQCYLFIWVPP